MRLYLILAPLRTRSTPLVGHMAQTCTYKNKRVGTEATPLLVIWLRVVHVQRRAGIEVPPWLVIWLPVVHIKGVPVPKPRPPVLTGLVEGLLNCNEYFLSCFDWFRCLILSLSVLENKPSSVSWDGMTTLASLLSTPIVDWSSLSDQDWMILLHWLPLTGPFAEDWLIPLHLTNPTLCKRVTVFCAKDRPLFFSGWQNSGCKTDQFLCCID